jgi:DNA polymerase-1
MESKKLVLVDGHSILNRAFYGMPDLTNAAGLHTGAVFGFLNILFKILDEEKADYLTVAFDVHAPTFRHEVYKEYKGTRKPMPEELREQVPLIKKVLQSMGVQIREQAGLEADDILGTLASMCEGEDCEAYLLTGDRDSLQLISDHVHVLLATNTETVDMDEAAFLAKYGVPSSSFVDVKALMGDSSDHIPGVAGIGEKTALKLIADYGSLDGVYEALPTAKLTPSNRAKLESGKESAYLSQLAQIVGTEAAAKILMNRQALEGYATITTNPASTVYLPNSVPAVIDLKQK